MAVAELSVDFPSPDTVNVSFEGTSSGSIAFSNPLTAKDRAEIQWYVETYGARSLADPDDLDAKRIEARLPDIGKALFDAVFSSKEAFQLYLAFRNGPAPQRVFNIIAQHASIHSLPWELLRDSSSGGTYLFREKPHISVRRRIPGSTGGRASFSIKPKDSLHLLFVVSRPKDVGFIDPRADSQAVLDALEKHAPGRVTCEFLRPASLNALVDRLADDSKPSVDILHFDGHGVFMQISEEDAERVPGLDRGTIQSLLLRERQSRGDASSNRPLGAGFLVFENEDRTKHLVPADQLSENLFRSHVALVVLSACQTASLGEESDPMASVAGRLTSTGIPAILAMTHSVLVATTRLLFGEFYNSLAKGRGIATSLDDSRAYLANNPQKYEVQRGSQRKLLELSDWFVPTLFEAGADSALLTSSESHREPEPAKHNLRKRHEAGFVGRRRELWDIECWFAGPTRRISITGFGGQGKTELALEAGRWLLRTGMFRQAVFVDYAGVQAQDALAVAVSTISAVVEETLASPDEVADALKRTPTLVILNNLETVSDQALSELLTAASDWSQAGDSRVLLTSRKPETGHPDYAVEGTFTHRRIQLDGLGSATNPDDALDLFARISLLPAAEPAQVPPPKRDELIHLFDRVRFHPLSICVLVQQLKTRTAKELDGRLEQILSSDAVSLVADEGTPRSLVASLQLSLERLSQAERHAVRRLGVFRGGAFEDSLLAITELGADSLWPGLRRRLEAAALIEAENILTVGPPFLCFHPTLAPMLWASLDPAEKVSLLLGHRQQYHKLANYLYQEDDEHPYQARAIARRELPNLVHAVQQALDARDPGGVEFADSITRFLRAFGMTTEVAALGSQIQKVACERGSDAWYLAQSGRGEQLFASGDAAEAGKIFSDILTALGDEPSRKTAVTLDRLGDCSKASGRPDLAESLYQRGIGVTEKLEQTRDVKQVRGQLRVGLGNALANQGKFAAAREQYEFSLEIKKEVNDIRGYAVAVGQLGALAIEEGNTVDAVNRYREALDLARRIGEPAAQAGIEHQLGVAFQKSNQLEQAEQHYREAASLSERIGNLAAAATTWNQLAIVSDILGKPQTAERWYRKSIDASKQFGATFATAISLCNLADLLIRQPDRLADARQLAKESLAIQKTLDPSAARIWKTFDLLAEISERDSQPQQAAEYRRLAREAKRKYAGTAHEMKEHLPIILAMWQAVQEPDKADELSAFLSEGEAHGFTKLVAAIRRILAGERDRESLCMNLDLEDSMIVETILDALKDPSVLEGLLETDRASE
jgi:tetratricopeptide (TPR) repeat protein